MVRRTYQPLAPSLCLQLHRISENPNAFDFGFNQITRQTITRGGNKIAIWLPVPAQFRIRRPGRTGGRPSDDDHAGFQGKVCREKMDEVGASPNHISSIAELAQLAVYSRSNVKYLRVRNFVGGNDARAQRGAAIKCLSPSQLIPSKFP